MPTQKLSNHSAIPKVKVGPGRAVREPGPHGLSIRMETWKSSFLDSSHYLSGLGQGLVRRQLHGPALSRAVLSASGSSLRCQTHLQSRGRNTQTSSETVKVRSVGPCAWCAPDAIYWGKDRAHATACMWRLEDNFQ